MGRTRSGHIVRVTIGALLSILGVLALASLVLLIYAGVTRTEISIGLGAFDVSLAPTDYELTVRQLHFGQPYITQRPDPTSTAICDTGKMHKTVFLSVSLYVQTCDHWSNQPYPTPIPTQVQPIPVYTGVPTVRAPISTSVP